MSIYIILNTQDVSLKYYLHNKW